VPRLHIIIYGCVAAEAECRSLVSDAGDDACGAQRDVHNSITTREMRAALVRGLVAAVLLVLPSTVERANAVARDCSALRRAPPHALQLPRTVNEAHAA